LLHPADESPQIAAVGPDNSQPSIHTHQPLDPRPGGIAVLHRCGSNHQGENQTKTVNHHMAFAPRDLFTRIVTASSRLIGCLDRLTPKGTPSAPRR
jgi:hypothetical protein